MVEKSVFGITSEHSNLSSLQTDYDRFSQGNPDKPYLVLGGKPRELLARMRPFDTQGNFWINDCEAVTVDDKILMTGNLSRSGRWPTRYLELDPNTPVFDNDGKLVGHASDLDSILQNPSIFK